MDGLYNRHKRWNEICKGQRFQIRFNLNVRKALLLFGQMLLEELKPIVKGHEPWEHTFHLASPFLVIGAALAGFLATRAFVHRHDSDAKAEEKS